MNAPRGIVYAILLGLLLPTCRDGGTSPILPAVNHPPVLVAIPDTSCGLGDTLHFQARAWDPDGDSITYGLAAVFTLEEFRSGWYAPAGIDAPSGAFWISLRSAHERRPFLLWASDGRGGSDSTKFVVEGRGMGAPQPQAITVPTPAAAP